MHLSVERNKKITIQKKINPANARNGNRPLVCIGAVGLLDENDKGPIMLILLVVRSLMFSCSKACPRYLSSVGILPRPDKGVFLSTLQ